MSKKSHHLHHLTTSFINAFIAKCPPAEILNIYFTPTASITEHGPIWARERLPFLATTFRGRRQKAIPDLQEQSRPQRQQQDETQQNTLDDYYALLIQTLKFLPQSDTLPPESEYIIDERANKVVVKLKGKFESLRTGKGWEEDFVYVMEMRHAVEGEEEWKIERLELWADPLSAWVACGE